MKNRTVVAATAASLLALCIAACASTPPEQQEEAAELPAVSIEGYADVVATLDFEHAIPSLPIDRYSLDAPEYVVTVLHAIAAAADACMVERGQPAIAGEYDWSPYLQDENRLFGLWSVEYASQYGQELAATTGPPRMNTVDRGVEFNEAYDECRTQATEELEEPLIFSQDRNIDSQIRSRAYELTLASDEGKAAEAAWQACMEDAGIVLEALDGRPSAQYQQQGKEAEIRAAVVEADCARSSGAIQTLYDLQARYESALIDSQSAQLQEFSGQRDEALAEFEAAIAG